MRLKTGAPGLQESDEVPVRVPVPGSPAQLDVSAVTTAVTMATMAAERDGAVARRTFPCVFGEKHLTSPNVCCVLGYRVGVDPQCMRVSDI